MRFIGIVSKEKQDELDRIVKKAGYKNVSKFMTAFEKIRISKRKKRQNDRLKDVDTPP